MKTHLLIVGTILSLAAPVFSLHADSPDGAKAKKHVAQTNSGMRTAAASHAPAVAHKNREVIYITNRTVTGSNIPVVVTRYHGENTTSSPFVSYDRAALDSTGSEDVGAELVARDPAISFARIR